MFKVFKKQIVKKSTNLTRSVQTINRSAHCNQKNLSCFIEYNRQFQISASPKTIKFPPNGCFEKDDFTLALAGGFLNCSGHIELKPTGGDLMQLSILCVQLYRLVRKEKCPHGPLFSCQSDIHLNIYVCSLNSSPFWRHQGARSCAQHAVPSAFLSFMTLLCCCFCWWVGLKSAHKSHWPLLCFMRLMERPTCSKGTALEHIDSFRRVF